MKHSPSSNTQARVQHKRHHARKHRQQSRWLLGAGLFLLLVGGAALLWAWPGGPHLAPLADTPTATPAQSVQPASAPDLAASALPTPPALPTDPALPTLPPVAAAEADSFFDPQRFSYEPDFYQPAMQAFLDAQPGPLKESRFQIGDRSQSAPAVLINLSNLYSFNPKILLALLEAQGGMLSTATPSREQAALALGYDGEQGNRRGLYSQIRWGAITLRQAVRDYAIHAPNGTLPELIFADDSRQPISTTMSLPRYALARLLARTTTPANLETRLAHFVQTYAQLFEDPRQPLPDPPPIAEPFLTLPMARIARVTSFFDHDTPFLQANGSLLPFWGTAEPFLSYDGHTGWDYGLFPPDVILAAAAGTVVFAGNSDDGCGTPARAVILDHANGYRTLYWHLSSLSVEDGQQVARGEQLGIAGSTGCSFGPHLHFQVQYLGRDVDPYGWCGADNSDPWAANPAGQRSVWLWQDMPSPCGPPPPDAVVVDDSAPGFAVSGEWQPSAQGYAGGARFTVTQNADRAALPWRVAPLVATPALAVWQAELPQAGWYQVRVYIPYILNGLDDATALYYRVQHRDGDRLVRVNSETYANFWADLGTYYFDPATRPASVRLSTLSDQDERGMWADAVMWLPTDAPAAE